MLLPNATLFLPLNKGQSFDLHRSPTLAAALWIGASFQLWEAGVPGQWFAAMAVTVNGQYPGGEKWRCWSSAKRVKCEALKRGNLISSRSLVVAVQQMCLPYSSIPSRWSVCAWVRN